jgi:pyruvyltransferase
MADVYATWCISNNFGDALTPWLIEKMTGKAPIYVEPSDYHAKYMVTGSILNWADKNTIVWGAGLANSADVVNIECEILATRGILSRNRAILCGNRNVSEVSGDPVMLLPRLYTPKTEKKYEIGIVPHYIDQAIVHTTLLNCNEQIKFINVFDPIDRVIEDINSCKRVLSSSLHGLIVADAYGIPTKWVECSNKVKGDGFKFKDHFSVTNTKEYKSLKLHSIFNKNIGELIQIIGSNTVKYDDKLLWESKPF